jgi:hypothetical protein
MFVVHISLSMCNGYMAAKVLIIEAIILCVPLILISAGGIITSPNGATAACYFLATLFISWVIWSNRATMHFVVNWTPALHKTLVEFMNNNANIGQKTLGDIEGFLSVVGASVSVLAAIFGISWLVLLQLQTAFSFLINRGRFDDALKFSVCNAGLSFLMILLSGGILAALSAPQLLWPGIQNGNPGYYVLWFVRIALYNTFWIEALKP